MSDRIAASRTSGGIPVVAERIPGSRSAGFMVGVATGSRDEVPGIFGLSHLLEHTVFRETGRMDSYQMAKEMEGAGGELNAFTAREMTAFYGITISETAGTAMDIVGDIVSDPLINEEDTELEKKIVLQELSMIESEPESRIHDLFETQLWRGHPLSQDEGGDSETVKRLTSEDLRAYYDEKYRIPNIAVYAAGDVSVEETAEWAERTFDGMSGGRRNERSPPPVPEAGYRYVQSETDHLQVAMGFPSYGASHPDRTALSMLSCVLGTGTSSRLFQSVRERKALVYSVYTTVSQESDASSLAAYMSCVDANAAEAMSTVSEEIGRLLSDGLEEGELERAKRLMKGANVRAMEETEHRLYRLCVNNMLNGSTESLEERLDKIDAVTGEDVMRVAEDVLRPDRMNVVVLGKAGRTVRKTEISDLAFRSGGRPGGIPVGYAIRAAHRRQIQRVLRGSRATTSGADGSQRPAVAPRGREPRMWSTALVALSTAASTSGVMVSDMVLMSWTSIATNLMSSGMTSGSILLPILMAVGRLTSWVAASARTSSKSLSEKIRTVPGP